MKQLEPAFSDAAITGLANVLGEAGSGLSIVDRMSRNELPTQYRHLDIPGLVETQLDIESSADAA